MTTYANLGTLKYKKLRFIPDCDILKTHEVNNLLREYIIYSLFREEEVPTVDVAGFAKIGLVSPDKDIDHSIAHEYMILQRDREEKDQISFLQQFGFSAVIENVPEPFNYWDYDRSNVFSKLVLQNFKNDDNSFYEKKILRAEKEIFLDPVTGSRYWILTQLVDLEDRGLFHNDDLGIDAKTGLWKNIPFDMDSSFECYLYNSDPEEIVKGFDSAKKSSYYSTLHRSARELFDDPDVLNRMLLLVDKFPFVDNKDKMKRTLELRFYYYALYFGSEEFSKKIGQTHVPYKNYDNYQKEAKRIINMKTFETMCHGRDFRDVLEQFVQPIKKNPDSIPPAPPQIPVPKI
jgi:hypothetical protein